MHQFSSNCFLILPNNWAGVPACVSWLFFTPVMEIFNVFFILWLPSLDKLFACHVVEKCLFQGEQFKLVKERIQSKLDIPEKEFEKVSFDKNVKNYNFQFPLHQIIISRRYCISFQCSNVLDLISLLCIKNDNVTKKTF